MSAPRARRERYRDTFGALRQDDDSPPSSSAVRMWPVAAISSWSPDHAIPTGSYIRNRTLREPRLQLIRMVSPLRETVRQRYPLRTHGEVIRSFRPEM